MNKMLLSKRAAEISVLFGLLCAVFLSMARFGAACDDLRHNVLRLHIIANSNSEEDQAVKLLVRDEILRLSNDFFSEISTIEAAEDSAAKKLDEFEKAARQVLSENGFEYGATAKIGNSYFETREYESFTLPAGNYKALKITLGNGNGKNWWCVCFPAICIPTATEARLSDSTSKASAAVAEQPKKYIMKFKAVEIYEDIKQKLSK